jgi:hypothetical protein
MGGTAPTKKKKKEKKLKKPKKTKVVEEEPDLLNTNDLREGSEPMIDLNFDIPAAVEKKPVKKSKKKWSEPKPVIVE